MVRILGIDIPPGLLDAWTKIFQFTDNTTQDNFIIKSAVPTRQKKTAWNIRSLFVRWQSLYDGFDTSRKASWTSYWGILPFGTHSGAGGWPGSGYSAFVYVNAPRYKAGLDLLLDPPILFRNWPNGDFHLGDAYCSFNEAFAIPSTRLDIQTSSAGGTFDFTSPDGDAYLSPGPTYLFEFDYSITNGSVIWYVYNTETATILASGTLAHTTDHISVEFTQPDELRLLNWSPLIEVDSSAEGWCDNFSVSIVP